MVEPLSLLKLSDIIFLYETNKVHCSFNVWYFLLFSKTSFQIIPLICLQIDKHGLIRPTRPKPLSYLCFSFLFQQCRQSILDTLTPDDIRILIETEDEFSRRGNFERVFPSPTSNKYHRFFDTTRYFNVLVDEWVRRYHRMPSKGENTRGDLSPFVSQLFIYMLYFF